MADTSADTINLTFDRATAVVVATACLAIAGAADTPDDVRYRLNAVVDDLLDQLDG